MCQGPDDGGLDGPGLRLRGEDLSKERHDLTHVLMGSLKLLA